MRSYHLALAFTLVVTSITRAADPAPPQSVRFDNQTLNLAWQGGSPDAPIYEFIPAGESLDRWTHLASIREYHSLEDLKALAAKTIETVKQIYPGAPTQLVENPHNGNVMVDFLVGPPNGSFVEYNVFQYSKRPAGGIVAQQYALRAYGDNIAAFNKVLNATRDRLLNEMADQGLETK